LHQLDPKLWVSLACPTTGLYFDKQTLKYLDRDGDGRIRLPEVIQVTNWVSRVLHNPGLILEPKDTIRLADLNTDDADGAAIHAAASRLLELLGKADAGEISLADVTNQQNILANARFNRSEEHTSELQSRENLVCRLLLEKKNKKRERQNMM